VVAGQTCPALAANLPHPMCPGGAKAESVEFSAIGCESYNTFPAVSDGDLGAQARTAL